ncbi:lysophospholipase D GDPD1-like [Tachypleus tridentatus]|uniref:lysophospholipase D GDPD1-like n=1 Tax=Tachypleus tridentatus TaxID=6853 RepID=UPI003FD161F1
MIVISLTFLGAYVLSSLLLFKYPTLIHRRKQLKFHCCHISHRGGAAENLENTLSAFENKGMVDRVDIEEHMSASDHCLIWCFTAYEVLQYEILCCEAKNDMLEIDVQLTKDGKVVVSHDNNLLRLAGCGINISDVNYDDIPSLQCVLPVDFTNGHCCQGGKDRKIPLLQDIFAKYPDIPINIDIKTNNDILIKETNKLIQKYQREEITVWGNFSYRITSKCFRENPNIPLLFSARKVFLLVLMMYTGLLPFVPLRESCLELFMPQVLARAKSKDNLWSPSVPAFIGKGLKMPETPSRFGIFHAVKYSLSCLRQIPAFEERLKKKSYSILFWLINRLLMNKALFHHLKKRGIQTYLWVLNEDKDYENAFQLGVTGVMTDYPSKLRKYLDLKQVAQS